MTPFDDFTPAPSHTSGSKMNRSATLGWATLAILFGGVLQGFGSDLKLALGSDFSWGGLGVLIGLSVAIWVARSFRWWLVLYLPVAWIGMAIISTAVWWSGAVSPITDFIASQVDHCRGKIIASELSAIAASIQSWNSEIQNTAFPLTEDFRRWSSDARNIEQQFAAVDHPRFLDDYFETAVAAFDAYELGFAQLADGNEYGWNIVGTGDSLVTDAQSKFRAATAECV